MSDPNTIRVIIPNGGSTRSYLGARFAELVFPRWGIDINNIWKSADGLGGASAGGVQSCSFGYGVDFPSIMNFYIEQCKRIWTSRLAPIGCDASTDSNKLSLAQKVAFILLNEPFYESPCLPDDGNSNFGHNILYQYLNAYFAGVKMSDLKTKVVIPVVEENNSTGVFYSNVNLPPPFKGTDALVSDVCKATTAAPIYLPTYSFNGNTNSDGGVFANNPVKMTINAVRTSKPKARRICIINLGAGLGAYGFHGTPTTDVESALSKLFNLFVKSTTLSQELNIQEVLMEQNYLLAETHVYNFQPLLDLTKDTEADASDSAFFDYLESVVQNHIAANQQKIDDFGVRWNL
jgi:hypothetical protein